MSDSTDPEILRMLPRISKGQLCSGVFISKGTHSQRYFPVIKSCMISFSLPKDPEHKVRPKQRSETTNLGVTQQPNLYNDQTEELTTSKDIILQLYRNDVQFDEKFLGDFCSLKTSTDAYRFIRFYGTHFIFEQIHLGGISRQIEKNDLKLVSNESNSSLEKYSTGNRRDSDVFGDSIFQNILDMKIIETRAVDSPVAFFYLLRRFIPSSFHHLVAIPLDLLARATEYIRRSTLTCDA